MPITAYSQAATTSYAETAAYIGGTKADARVLFTKPAGEKLADGQLIAAQSSADSRRNQAERTSAPTGTFANTLSPAAATASTIPIVGPVIAAVLAAVSAVIAVLGQINVSGKQQEGPAKDQDAGVAYPGGERHTRHKITDL